MKFLKYKKMMHAKIDRYGKEGRTNRIDVYKKELGLEYRLDKGHFVEYTLESFEEELRKAGLKLVDYNVQFSEIWAIVEVLKWD